MRRFIAIWILLSAGLNIWQMNRIAELEEKRPIVIYKEDNQGAEIKGRVAHKEKIGELYTITIQMCIKYQLSNAEIKFLAKQQPGVVNYQKHSKERNAYAEMMRGLQKLKELNFPEIYNHSLSAEDEQKKFEEEMAVEQKYISPYQKLDEIEKRFYENQFLFGKKVMEAGMEIVSSEKKIAVDNFFNIGSRRIKFTVEEVTD